MNITGFRELAFVKELEQTALVKTFHAGDIIIDYNQYIRWTPIIHTGLIGVYRTDEDSREILLYYIRPGESCIMSFLAGINHDISKIKAVAEEDSELYLFPVEKSNTWLQQFPEWNRYLFKLYQQRFEDLLEVVNSIAFKKMDERLAGHLKKKSELVQSSELSITHSQLADELGTTREVVSRLLKQMEKEGLLKLSRNKITLL